MDALVVLLRPDSELFSRKLEILLLGLCLVLAVDEILLDALEAFDLLEVSYLFDRLFLLFYSFFQNFLKKFFPQNWIFRVEIGHGTANQTLLYRPCGRDPVFDVPERAVPESDDFFVWVAFRFFLVNQILFDL